MARVQYLVDPAVNSVISAPGDLDDATAQHGAPHAAIGGGRLVVVSLESGPGRQRGTANVLRIRRMQGGFRVAYRLTAEAAQCGIGDEVAFGTASLGRAACAQLPPGPGSSAGEYVLVYSAVDKDRRRHAMDKWSVWMMRSADPYRFNPSEAVRMVGNGWEEINEMGRGPRDPVLLSTRGGGLEIYVTASDITGPAVAQRAVWDPAEMRWVADPEPLRLPTWCKRFNGSVALRDGRRMAFFDLASDTHDPSDSSVWALAPEAGLTALVRSAGERRPLVAAPGSHCVYATAVRSGDYTEVVYRAIVAGRRAAGLHRAVLTDDALEELVLG